MNLFQNADFAGVMTNPVAPTLMRRSFLYDIISDQELLPLQHLLIQGFPVPLDGVVDTSISAHFAFPSLISPLATEEDDHLLSADSVRSLAGNSMHWSALASWLVFVWSVGALRPCAEL